MEAVRIDAAGPEVIIGLRDLRTVVGGVRIHRDHEVRMRMPAAITLDHVGVMRQDLTEILRIATEQPETVVEFQHAALRNDFPTVNRLADQMGLSEKYLQRAGGGKLGELITVGVIVLILIVATPSEPAPQPNPGPGPTPIPDNPDAGGGDAGGDGG